MMGYYGGMGFGWLGMALFWVLVAVVVVYLLRVFSQGQAPGHKDGQAMEILRERYARGEIGQEEFEARRRDLGA
jgi:putative membrane protein